MDQQSHGESLETARAALRESKETNHGEPIALAGETVALLRSEMRLAFGDALRELVAPENREATKALLGILFDLALSVGKDRAARRAGFWMGDVVWGVLRHAAIFLLVGGLIVKFFGVGALISIWSQFGHGGDS